MKYILISLAVITSACQNHKQASDAYGNFEATTVTVSAETTGKIKFFHITEGQNIQEGQYVGLIDTTQLHLRKQQLEAHAQTIQSRSPHIVSQAAVLFEQRKNAEKELERFRKLAEDGAATQKQVDDLQAQIAVLTRQIQATQAQNAPLISEMQMVQAQIDQIEEQIESAQVRAPITGKVLLKLAEAGEMANAGTPLFHMASLDTLTLRAYISGSQLSQIQLGQSAEVLIDQDADAYKKLQGKVTWIADQAEFTPKTIQTKDERVDLVYAIKVRVPNDGSLKIGMPGEINFFYDAEKLASH